MGTERRARGECAWGMAFWIFFGIGILALAAFAFLWRVIVAVHEGEDL
jgi:hypothetical protein